MANRIFEHWEAQMVNINSPRLPVALYNVVECFTKELWVLVCLVTCKGYACWGLHVEFDTQFDLQLNPGGQPIDCPSH